MADPPSTDQRIIAELRTAAGDLATAELASRLALHPNGVRVRLRLLRARGLVESSQQRRGPGRPADHWRLTARAVAETDSPHLGWAMARSLASAIRPTRERLAEIEHEGVRLGEELALGPGAAGPEEARSAIEHAITAMGFEPSTEVTPGGARYRLGVCPFADLVRENPAVICTLHKGMMRGVLGEIGAGARLTRFEPRDPSEAGCIVDVELPGG